MNPEILYEDAYLVLDGYIDIIKQDGMDIGSFFSPFYRIMSKELDFKKKQ